MVDFIRITNREIYDKLECIEGHVLKINGKVNRNKWIASTALATGFFAIGFIIQILQGG